MPVLPAIPWGVPDEAVSPVDPWSLPEDDAPADAPADAVDAPYLPSIQDWSLPEDGAPPADDAAPTRCRSISGSTPVPRGSTGRCRRGGGRAEALVREPRRSTTDHAL